MTPSLKPQEVVPYPSQYGYSVGPRMIRGVLCEDGKQRTAQCSAKGPDTFFSVPARIKVKGKTVSGFVTQENNWCIRCNRSHTDHNYHLPDGSYDPSLIGRCSDGQTAIYEQGVYLFIAYLYGKNAGLVKQFGVHDE
jgi:hypothetical protein